MSDNIDEVLRALERKRQKMHFGVKVAVRRASLAAVNEIQKTILPVYNDGHRRDDGRTTDAAVGGPPMQRTGNLRRSIRASEPVSEGFGTWYATAGPGAVYARALELGMGKTGVTYPFMEPARKRLIASGKLARIYANAMRKAME